MFAASNSRIRVIERETVICRDVDLKFWQRGFLTKDLELARLQGNEGDKAKKGENPHPAGS